MDAICEVPASVPEECHCAQDSSTSTTQTDDSRASCSLEMNDGVVPTQIRLFLRNEWRKVRGVAALRGPRSSQLAALVDREGLVPAAFGYNSQ